MARPRETILLWENFGPTHADRCAAAAAVLDGPVTGLEVLGRSATYDWIPEAGTGFAKVTLFPDPGAAPGWPRRLRACLRFWAGRPRAAWFLCHYDWPDIFLFACLLRLTGTPVFAMMDSKFDDKPRHLRRELLKALFLAPYRGAIGCEHRSMDYLRFLGVARARIRPGYDTLSTGRIRALAGAPPAPGGLPHAERQFTVVARLVPKKNLEMALEAFALFRAATGSPRPLVLCGSGPLEDALRQRVHALGLEEAVRFTGFVQTAEVARQLARSLALLLPSTEEQFGLVVAEALAMGVPVLLSENCGARDSLVRSAVNGFVVEPDNPQGLAWFMQQLSGDAALWQRMARAALDRAPRGDAARFAESVRSLLGEAA